MSRIPEADPSVTIITDVLKVVCIYIHPFVESVTDAPLKDLDPEEASNIQEEEINTPALLIICLRGTSLHHHKQRLII